MGCFRIDLWVLPVGGSLFPMLLLMIMLVLVPSSTAFAGDAQLHFQTRSTRLQLENRNSNKNGGWTIDGKDWNSYWNKILNQQETSSLSKNDYDNDSNDDKTMTPLDIEELMSQEIAQLNQASPVSPTPPESDDSNDDDESFFSPTDQHQYQYRGDEPLDADTTNAYEQLDKWKGCTAPGAPVRLVYNHNRSRAAATGFPTRLQVGTNLGLTDHETAAIFGWTTGDYRLLNPIARGLERTEFDEYPFLPYEMTKTPCLLDRQDVLPYVRVLSSALSKLDSLDSSRETLWRGHGRNLDQLEVGSIVTMKGFTSATRDRDNAITFAAKPNEGVSDQRTLLVLLEHSSGRCISKLSARSEEMEVVFPLDTKWEVVDPPLEDTECDKDCSAVQQAMEQLRRTIPEAEIGLVYVKEVVPGGNEGPYLPSSHDDSILAP